MLKRAHSKREELYSFLRKESLFKLFFISSFLIFFLGGTYSDNLVAKSSSNIRKKQKTVVETVYVTRTGKKFHKVGCQYLRKSCIAIKKAKAVRLNYSPCSKCYGKSYRLDKKKKYVKPVSYTSVQCSGITKKGRRCRRKTTHSSGYCWQHR